MTLRSTQREFLDVRINSKWWQQDGRRLPVLGQIAFEMPRASSLAIMGPSGIGKTTLLKVIAGLDRFYDGTVLLDGAPVRFGSGDVQLVFQDDRLFEPFTALQNVCYALPEPTTRDAIAEGRRWLSRLRIEDRAGEYPIRLSGGEKKRVALARALIRLPKLLLLDEPLGSLDVQVAAEVSADLLALTKESEVSLIVTTHNPADALALADRALFLGGDPAAIRTELDLHDARGDPERFAALHAEIRAVMGG